jgi:hypothetical protein
MFIDMGVFMWLAYRYKSIPLEDLDKIDDEELLKSEEKRIGKDNDGFNKD